MEDLVNPKNEEKEDFVRRERVLRGTRVIRLHGGDSPYTVRGLDGDSDVLTSHPSPERDDKR